MKITKHNIGQFEVKSGKLIVTDPCLNEISDCNSILENVKNGIWNAEVIRISYENDPFVKCSELIIYSEDFSEKDWIDSGFKIDVFSGQAGFWDELNYEWGNGEVGELNTFYGKCCEATSDHNIELTLLLIPIRFKLENNNSVHYDDKYYEIIDHHYEKTICAGIVGNGVVASSGYGDGIYGCYVAKNDAGKIIAAKLEFIYYDK